MLQPDPGEALRTWGWWWGGVGWKKKGGGVLRVQPSEALSGRKSIWD